jgi:5'-phosphate synthase pdxT subunit
MTFPLPRSPISWTLSGKPQKNLGTITIGVLALQGDFLEHILTLKQIGVTPKEIRLPRQLEQVDGLIIPGGESTTMANLLDTFQLRSPLIKRIQAGMPAWGTCAGMILLAKKLLQEKPIPLGVMDIVVNRNAFGRQIDSFAIGLSLPFLGEELLPATFIRAPLITETGPGVEILATLPNGTIIAARQRNILATAFHPELTGDTRFHEYFISITATIH